MITGIYAGLSGILLLILSARVILYRRSNRISIGTSEDRLLERRIRAQGNLVEYAPLVLIILWLLEAGGTSGWLIHALGGALLLGRVMHGLALSAAAPKPVLRIGGMALTLTVLAVGSVVLFATSIL